MEDYYNILNVAPNSSTDDIKKAFRKLSLKHHPDKNGGKEEVFKKINEAYQTLGNTEKKKVYDMQQNNPFRGLPGGPMMGNPEDFINMMFGGLVGGMPGGMPGGMAMPFGFGGMPGTGGQSVRIFHNGMPVHMNNMAQTRHVNFNTPKPSPIIKSIEITLEQAYNGLNYPLKIEKWIMDGNIKKVENETIYIDIKAGIDNGEIMLLTNRGNILNDNNKGDVKIFTKIINNTPFTRDGLDLLFTKEISLKEALVGFSFDFKHLSGKTYTINNKVGKVVTPDFIKEIPNMGMRRTRPHPASPMVGNLIICFKIIYPTTITEEKQKKSIEIL